MKFIDSHAHYLVRQFNKDRDRLLFNMHKNGVEYIINSTGTNELNEGLKLSRKYDFIYLSIGDGCAITPPEGDEYISDDIIKTMIKLCAENKKIVAWGEIGIGLNRDELTRNNGKEKQLYWFKKQLDAAKMVKLPVVIHSRDACQIVFDTLREAEMPDYGSGRGMLHCYSGSPEMALEYVEMGYLISITGVVTYRTAQNLVETVRVVPIDKLLIETDCPYLSPEPMRGKRNDSGNLKFVIDRIAEIKRITPEEVAEQTTANAKAFFGIK
ncbi:MAG: TatD family hydrolase [Treponema sp.]|nr:TatD family hydrolase [Treponema sp.]